MQRPSIRLTIPLALSFAYGLFAAVVARRNWPLEGEITTALMIFAIVPLGLLALQWSYVRYTTTGKLRDFLRARREVEVCANSFAHYRYADLFRAITRYSEKAARCEPLEGNYGEDLQTILQSAFFPAFERYRIRPAIKAAYSVGYKQTEYLPSDSFWLVDVPGQPLHVIRLSILYQQVRLEIACRVSNVAKALLDQIVEDSVANSIFRGQMLEIRFDQRPIDDYDYAAHSAGFKVQFKERPQVTDGQIVLDENKIEILRRNVFDFHRHRASLKAHGVPAKRALLFHGPPGTGKTYTCKYIQTLLPDVTTIVVTGDTLSRMEDVCTFARMLQPSLVILEDVDLVFSSREVNLYSSALGDFMDQLDGFHSDDAILFVLTTNAIDRLEQAIRDRPGRINQCLYFGPPVPELRRRYLRRYLEPYDCNEVDFEHLVRQSDGATQAFLREYVHRAVQIGVEAAGYASNGPVRLQTSFFNTAYAELTEQNDKHTRSIIGFHDRR